MKEVPAWELLEREIDKSFPNAKQTSGSGRIWGDGDRVLGELCFEAKRHKQVAFDSWWEQTRQQAEKWNKIPILVFWRPPAQLKFAKSISDEVIAACPLWYLGKLYTENQKLKEQVVLLATANKKLRNEKDGKEGTANK